MLPGIHFVRRLLRPHSRRHHFDQSDDEELRQKLDPNASQRFVVRLRHYRLKHFKTFKVYQCCCFAFQYGRGSSLKNVVVLEFSLNGSCTCIWNLCFLPLNHILYDLGTQENAKTGKLEKPLKYFLNFELWSCWQYF